VNRNFLMVLLGCLLLAACTFDAPLAPDSSLSIDEALLGTWAILPDEGEDDSGEIVSVLRGADHRYLIEHRDGDSVIYFNGWLGEIEGRRFLQLEVTGDEHGPAEPGEADLYSVISYEFDGQDLIMRSLNTELVDPASPDTEQLRLAFIQHIDNADLFIEPGRLRRL
jgi:hypothetical protein